jgi:hypothetical protein
MRHELWLGVPKNEEINLQRSSKHHFFCIYRSRSSQPALDFSKTSAGTILTRICLRTAELHLNLLSIQWIEAPCYCQTTRDQNQWFASFHRSRVDRSSSRPCLRLCRDAGYLWSMICNRLETCFRGSTCRTRQEVQAFQQAI